MSSPGPGSLGFIDGSWTDEQRRVIWCLICKARHGLQLEVSPIVASAFVILQRYFRNSEGCAHELFILMVAALFTACKAADCYRPVRAIYAELMHICHNAPSLKIRSIPGDRERPVVDPIDLAQITHAELDLLRSIDFDFAIDTPFTHFEKWKQTLMSSLPDPAYIRLCNAIVVDICLMLCSAAYLDVPPEVSAAAATAGRVGSCVIPMDAIRWLNHVREKYGKDLFDLAQASISLEKRRTVQPGNRAAC
jgi:hypothetical protein